MPMPKVDAAKVAKGLTRSVNAAAKQARKDKPK